VSIVDLKVTHAVLLATRYIIIALELLLITLYIYGYLIPISGPVHSTKVA